MTFKFVAVMEDMSLHQFKSISTHSEHPGQSTQVTQRATATSAPTRIRPNLHDNVTKYSSQDKRATNQICEDQLETSVKPTGSIRKEQEHLELNNERDKVTDKTPKTAENVCKLNKRRCK